MQNFNLDEGYKEFTINNDPNRVIRFNPADYGIIERINEAYKEIEKISKIKEDIELRADGTPIEEFAKAAEVVNKVSTTIKKQIDYIFNSDVSDVVFGKQSPLSTIKGMPLYERFLEVVMPEIKKEIESERKASEKRIEKYTKQVIK